MKTEVDFITLIYDLMLWYEIYPKCLLIRDRNECGLRTPQLTTTSTPPVHKAIAQLFEIPKTYKKIIEI